MTPDQAVRDWLRRMGEVSTTSAGEIPREAGVKAPPFPGGDLLARGPQTS